MKSLVRDIVVFLLGIIAEIYIFIYMPYQEATYGHGDGFIILVPVFVTPIIGLVMGLLLKRNFKFTFPVIPAVFSIFFMQTYYGYIEIGYIFIFLFGTLIGLGIGWGIRTLIKG